MHVADNDGAQTPGVDGVTQETWVTNLKENLDQLLKELRTGTYRP